MVGQPDPAEELRRLFETEMKPHVHAVTDIVMDQTHYFWQGLVKRGFPPDDALTLTNTYLDSLCKGSHPK